MRGFLAVAIVVLWGCHQSAVAHSAASSDGQQRGQLENLFANEEQSTSFASQALFSCMNGLDDAEASQPKKRATKPHAKTWYCVCLADAVFVLKTPTVSVEQAGPRCVEFARKATPKTPTNTRTPYAGNSYFNVGQMADALKSCRAKLEQAPKTQGLHELQKETFCSCVIDSMRYRRTMSTNVPVEETRICANAAGWSW